MKTSPIFRTRNLVILLLTLTICASALGLLSASSSAKIASSTTPEASSPGPCIAPPSGLVSWWPGQGNANDIQGNNTGTVQNGVSFAPGQVGQAFSFNGSNQYVLIGDPVPPALRIQNEITLAAWIFVTAYPSELGVIIGSQLDANQAGATIMLDGRTNPDGQPSPAGHIHFQIGDGSFHVSNANAQVPLNQWVHIAATRKANEDAKIYYNGVLQPSTSAPWTGGISYDGAWFAIGQQKNMNRPFNGQIDEPEIYNRALNASEILSIVNAGSAGKCQSPAVSIVDAQVMPGTSNTKQVNFTVNVARPDGSAIDVQYQTVDGSALAGTDYVATSGTLHFAANEASKTIPVTVNGLARTSSKAFTVTLSSPVNAVINRPSATGTILTGNPVNDYRNVNDGNQTWQYGYSQTDGTGFFNFVIFEPSNGTLSSWGKPSSQMGIVQNVTNHDINYNICTLQPVGTMAVFPGNDGRKSVVRWKAPEAGTFNISGRFQNVDQTTSDISIVKNENIGSPLFADVINGGACNSTNVLKPFALNVPVNAGDTIDFRVGWGDNNAFHFDGTGLVLNIENAQVNQTITVNTHAPANAVYNSQFTVAATSDSGLPVTYSSSGSCTNVGAVFTMTSGTGTCTVKYDQAGNSSFNAAVQVTETVNAQKANQSISVNTNAPANAVYNSQFTVTATSNSNLAVSFSSSGSCTNTGALFTMTSGTGTCTVKYDQSGDNNYNAATQVVETVNAQKATLTITADEKTRQYRATDPTFTFTPTGFVNGDTESVLTGAPALTTTATNTSNVGPYPINAAVGTLTAANYAFSFVAGTLTITKATPAISWSNPADIVYGTLLSGTQLNATATNPNDNSSVTGTFTYTPTSGTKLNAGDSQTLHVDLAPTDTTNYNSASKDVSINVLKANQTITVDTHAPANRIYNTSFGVAATSDSSLTVTFSSSGVCTNTGATFTMTSGTGTCTVKYDQAGDSNYNAAAQVTETVTAQKADQTINFGTINDRTFGDADFAISATASSNLAVAFGVTGQCTLTGLMVHITGSGSCTVTASQAGDTNHNAAPNVPRFFNIAKAAATITLGNLTHSHDGNPKFATATTNPAGLNVAISYSQGGSPVAAPTNVGSYDVLATINEANYQGSVTGTLVINSKITPTLNWGNPVDITFGTALTATQLNATATNPNNGSSVPGTFIYTPALNTVLNAGPAQTLRVDFTPTDLTSFNSATKNVSVNVLKADQTINFPSLTGKTFGEADFNVSATSSSGLAVSFAASGQCTIAGNTVHITGAGSCTITASQSGNSNFNAAPNVPQVFSIAKANQTITFGALSNKTINDPDFNVSASASSGLAVSFAAVGQCSVTGSTVQITAAGSCTITASQSGDSNFNAATNVPQTFSINKLDQTITFADLGNKTFGDADFNVAATSTSGLAVSFTATGQCTITSTTVHITAVGSCTITASQSGNSTYNTATNVDRIFTITKANQTITFAPLANRTYGVPPFVLSATSTSGLTVTFTIVSGPATINGSAVTLTGVGQVIVRALQSGNNNYNAAASVDQPFNVAPNPTPPVPQFGANGKLVFTEGGKLYILNSDGTGLHPVPHSGEASEPSWSPDGSKIVFRSQDSSGVHISVINTDGSNLQRLTTSSDPNFHNPKWSPDGTRIAYEKSGSGNRVLIHIMSAQNGEAGGSIQVINSSSFAGKTTDATWSPDSSRIAFSDNPNQSGLNTDLKIITLSTNQITQSPMSGVTLNGADWSPDGGKILCVARSSSGNPTEVYVVNLNNNTVQRLTFDGWEQVSPAWSSDGLEVAYHQVTGNTANPVGLYVTSTDGQRLRRIRNTSGAIEIDWNLRPLSSTTRTGSNSTVRTGTAALTFSNVSNPGVTIVNPIDPVAAGSVSNRYVIDGTSTAYEVTTTASFTPPITLCFKATLLPGQTSSDFFKLRILHGETNSNGQKVMVDRTTSHDYATRTICASVNSLSPFLVATDTVPPVGNEIDDTNNFVAQHYRDFLERESDPDGLAFWANEINSCGSNQQCVEVKRINVSAAFYLSIEFQETGYLLERLYKSAHGDATGTSSLGGTHSLPVPIIRYDEFLTDMQQIRDGVVVNQSGWEQVLEQNKRAFLLSFVQRSRFSDAYPTTMTPTQFVEALFSNTGVTPSSAERQAAIDEFGGASNSSDNNARSRVLRRVAENSTFGQMEFNRAFVLMQYFAYLRRNPNDAPDGDYTGYDFWLSKLNQFNGNFVNAEMVKAFILSGEYRGRFGSN